MNKYFRHILIIVIALITLLSQEGDLMAGPYDMKTDTSRWVIELPLWVPAGFNGYFTWGDITISSDNEGDSGGSGIFDKLFNSDTGLDYYFVGRINYSYEKWQFQTDIFGGRINNSVQFEYGNISLIDTKIATLMPRAYVSYQLVEKKLNNGNAGRINAHLLAGTRLFKIDISTKPPLLSPIDLSSTWLNPIIGAGLSYDIHRFSFSTQFDIGMIEMFSHPTWWLQHKIIYRIGNRLSVSLGWVRQDIKKETELLDKDFYLDIHLKGPMTGIAIHF